MTPKEKRLLAIAGGLFLLYVLPVIVVPSIQKWGMDEYTGIQQRKDQVHRLRRLGNQHTKWQQENDKATKKQTDIEAGLLTGRTQNLIAADLQSILKKQAGSSKLRIKSLELAEFVGLENWLLVSQKLRFEAKSQHLFDFVNGLKIGEIRLEIVDLEVRVARANQLQGTITISGFSHLLAAED